ncbi:MAG: hypothetical protein K2Y22_09000 [Candidatus Obscuribacterales bacterium]|nr:hypothetical protein [Candidatus Obscuribacterales bacterium]
MKTSKKQKNTGKTTKGIERGSTVDYMDYLLKDLQDPEFAAGYLTACFEEDEGAFLLALRDVVQAQGGMTSVSVATKLNRENLYDMLSKSGNPRFSSMTALIRHLGFSIQFVPRGN